MIEKLEKIIKDLKEINRTLKNKSIEKAIKEIEIAIREQNFKLKRKSNESIEHYMMKNLLFNTITKDGDAYYLEAENIKLSKMGYRPDIVVVRENDAIFIEIEKNPKNIIKKLKNIKNKSEKIKKHPILIGRNIRVIFGILSQINEEILEEIKKISRYIDFDVDVYLYENEELRRII